MSIAGLPGCTVTWGAAIIAVLAVAAARADGQTRLVRDVRTGPGSSFPDALVAMDDALFFVADDGEHGRELWRSDGTTAGTLMVADINPGRSDAFPYNDRLVVLGGRVFFGADDGRGGAQLWQSDGTAEGTVLVEDVDPGKPFRGGVRHLVAVDGTLYFMVTTGVETAEGLDGSDRLWKSDGTTAGTVAVTDLGIYKPGGFGVTRRVEQLLPFSGAVLVTLSQYTECCEMIELVLVDANGGSQGLFFRVGGHLQFGLRPPSNLTVAGGAMFFTIDGYGTPACELWRTDIGGSQRLALPGFGCGMSSLAGGDGVLFFTRDEDSGTGLWKVDTSGQHPMLVTVPAHGLPGYPTLSDLTAVGNALFFPVQAGQERALWTSDGTAAGTVRVRNFSFGPTTLTNLSGTLLFAAYDGQTVPAFWTSDGTPDGTVRVGSLPSAVSDLVPPLVMAGEHVFFVAPDRAHGAELWALPVHALTGTCPGDCDANRSVTVEEVIVGVNIALGVTSVAACDIADFNGDGEVTVDELLVAVNRALDGCGRAAAEEMP